MKKSILIIAILLSISVIYAQERITASGGIVTEEYNLDAFTVVDINFIGDVVIKQSTKNHKVSIKANDNSFIKYTHIDVKKGKLTIYNKFDVIVDTLGEKEIVYMDNGNSHKKPYIRVEICLPHLEELSLSGPGDVTVEKRNEPQLTVINSGAGDCTLQCLKIEGTLELHNKGAGDIKVKSSDPIRQQTLLIDNACAGDISILGSHVSKTLVVNNIGPGDVSVNLMSIPTEELILQNKGAGDITIQNILANKVELRNQGAGDMKLMNGKADEMTLVSVGAGTVNTQLLKVTTAHITHCSVGNTLAYVTGITYLSYKSKVGNGNVRLSGGGKVVEE